MRKLMHEGVDYAVVTLRTPFGVDVDVLGGGVTRAQYFSHKDAVLFLGRCPPPVVEAFVDEIFAHRRIKSR